MKKTTLILLLTTTMSIAQISIVDIEKPQSIGKIASFGKTFIECEKISNEYTFTYSDHTYLKIDVYKSFSFNNENDAFNTLYSMIMNGFKNKPEEDVFISIPNGIVKLEFLKSFGVTNFRFVHIENSVTGIGPWLTEKKLQRLFGKL